MSSSLVVGLQKHALAESVQNLNVELPNGLYTPVHVVKYSRSKVHPQVVVFEKPTRLLEWCRHNNVSEGINGGFSLHHENILLGEVWKAGKKHDTLQIEEPWHEIRGSAHITAEGHLKLAPRHHLPKHPDGDLLQAGPLLVHEGVSLIKDGHDPDGISAASHQLDDDWTTGHWPRAAIGADDKYIWCVATDGYLPGGINGEFGLSLEELAEVMLHLGATEALNLDGGSSASLVSDGKLINKSRAGAKHNYAVYPIGIPIPTAIIFEPK